MSERPMIDRPMLCLLRVTDKRTDEKWFVVPANSPCEGERSHYWQFKPNFWMLPEDYARQHMQETLLLVYRQEQAVKFGKAA